MDLHPERIAAASRRNALVAADVQVIVLSYRFAEACMAWQHSLLVADPLATTKLTI